MGLGDTHEDLPFVHNRTKPEYLQLLFSVVEATCARLLELWSQTETPDDRDLGFPLFALSRLGIYKEDVFGAASALLVSKLIVDRGLQASATGLASQQLSAEALRQWLLACNSVDFSLLEHEKSIAGYTYPRPIREEDDSRLHQLAGALVFLKDPDPLMTTVLEEINRRDENQFKDSKAVALYGLQAARLFTERGVMDIKARLTPGHVERFEFYLEEKTSKVRRVSHLEHEVGDALERLSLNPDHNVVVGHGFSADFRCSRDGVNFFVEVDGPSHFCVRPPWRPRGRTRLKQRLFEALGLRLVSVPYWLVSSPGAYGYRGASQRPSLDPNLEELEHHILQQVERTDLE